MNINSNKRWSRLEEVKLHQMVVDGYNCAQISERLGRSEKGIRLKVYKRKVWLTKLGRIEEANQLNAIKQGPRKRRVKRNQLNGIASPKIPEQKPVETKPANTGLLTDIPVVHNSKQLNEIFSALIVIAIGVWATAAGLFLAVLQ